MTPTIHSAAIETKIFTLRGMQVMIDRDLAELYGVETRVLNQAVKRNMERFPEHFMFQITASELDKWKSQIVISNKETMGLRKMPYAFTEQGVSMLSAILRSPTAIEVSIKIIDSFVQIRRYMSQNSTLFQRVDLLEMQQKQTNEKIDTILNAIEDKSIQPKQGIFFNATTTILTKSISKAMQLDLQKHNAQYKPITLLRYSHQKAVKNDAYGTHQKW
ncbi:MAG: ORF6N domain-containing protein [Campylobacterales bacterium]|nr:ORF6N domain-containing protein [Campylobacterales bacterium]